jgi:hypothetical protein
MRTVAIVVAVMGLVMVCAAVASDGAPPLEPIPLRAASVATPISFPHTPPIRSTPMFVPVNLRNLPMSNHHRQTLMAWYTVEQREPEMGAH